MEFTRSWKWGAKSCCATWNRPDTRLKFTTYPMIHVASPAFYRQVSQELADFDYILCEGVSWHKDNRCHPFYDLAAKNLGWAEQREALQYPSHVRKINIDMPRAEFRARFQKLPLRARFLLIYTRPLLWLLTKFANVKEDILRLLPKGEAKKYQSSAETAREKLIRNERDAAITGNIEKFYHEHSQTDKTTSVAIVFGAGHMAAISRCLRRLGYKPIHKRWLAMVRSEDVGPI